MSSLNVSFWDKLPVYLPPPDTYTTREKRPVHQVERFGAGPSVRPEPTERQDQAKLSV